MAGSIVCNQAGLHKNNINVWIWPSVGYSLFCQYFFLLKTLLVYCPSVFPAHTRGRWPRQRKAQDKQGRKITFKLIYQRLRRSDPWAGGRCVRQRCIPWIEEGSEYCEDKLACYLGETGRNSYRRGMEHLDNLEARSEDNFVLWLHSFYHHKRQGDMRYSKWSHEPRKTP